MMLVKEDQSDRSDAQYEEDQEHPAGLQQRMGYKSAQSTEDESESWGVFLCMRRAEHMPCAPESGL